MGARENRLGYAGELYVAAQLAHRGWDVALLAGGAQRHDLLAISGEGGVPQGRTIQVQCKTTTAVAMDVGEAIESASGAGDGEWVIFVVIDEFVPERSPAFYVVPRRIVATFVYLGTRHLRPKEEPGPQARRSVKPRDFAHYREGWSRLTQDPARVPWLFDLDGGFWQWWDNGQLPIDLAVPERPSHALLEAP